MAGNPSATPRLSTGIAGLDDILCGGFPARRMYLVQGDPGVGKTTMALQFLLEGARLGERVLYVTLSETAEELISVARAHGWSLDQVTIWEMSVGEGHGAIEDENTLYVPAEVELGERMQELLTQVDEVKPTRIVLDSCSELRLLAQSPLRFRRQLLALKEDLIRRNCTILLLENPASSGGDVLLQSMVHGVLTLEQLSPLYGAERRRVRVVKVREVKFRGGFHDVTIHSGGLRVFPRLVASEHHRAFSDPPASSGIAELDELLGGGLDRGTATLLLGPAGSGKSAFAAQYAVAAAQRGEHVAMFAFDEGIGTLFSRAASLGMDLAGHAEARRITVQQIDPAEMSPGEFVHTVRDAVEQDGARMIVIDSLNGYLQAMPEEQFLTIQLHELISYLRQRGVVLVMVVAEHGLFGSTSPIDVSYMADTVVLTRYFEAAGRLRKAVSVVKKRSGRHEDTIREFTLGPTGFEVGPALEQFRGILTGVPVPTTEGSSKAADRSS